MSPRTPELTGLSPDPACPRSELNGARNGGWPDPACPRSGPAWPAGERPAPIRAGDFKEALSRLPMSVSVVTTRDELGTPYGVTVGSVCSLSLAPPLLLFCLNRASSTHRAFTTAGRFLVHVLRHDQQEVAARFAARGVDRWNGDQGSAHGLPAIPGALVRILCSLHHVVRGGDHSIIVGLVEEAAPGQGDPLLYYDRRYHGLSEAMSPMPK